MARRSGDQRRDINHLRDREYAVRRGRRDKSTSGSRNSFFGMNAGANVAGIAGNGLGISAVDNSYFGSRSGEQTTSGYYNSFFGSESGRANTNGNNNSFFGFQSGLSTIGGRSNTFAGSHSGENNSSGNSNTFIGYIAGPANTTGSNNTLLGASTNVGAPDVSFGTAIGAGSVVSTSNSIVLGRANGSDTVNIPGNLSVAGTITGTLPTGSANYIQNTTSLQASTNFNISGLGKASQFDVGSYYKIRGRTVLCLDGNSISVNSTCALGQGNTSVGYDSGIAGLGGTDNSFFGISAGRNNTYASFNSFFGGLSGVQNTIGEANSFFGYRSGGNNIDGSSNAFFGVESD